MFIPKKRRLVVTPDGDARKTKRPRPLDGDTGREALLPDVHALERRRDNVLVTAFMAINLYLQPHVVFATSLYWIAEYVNYNRRSGIDWFVDHIEQLLAHEVAFNITSSRGISHTQSHQMKHNLLPHFAGSDLHKVVNEYFIVLRNQTLIEALIHLTRPENAAFLVPAEHAGLRGEIELDCFLYDRVLNFFYEPSFYVITAYLIYLSQLFYQSGGRDMVEDFAPVLERIAPPLLVIEPGCLCRENSNYAGKQAILLRDLRVLHSIVTQSTDEEEMMSALCALWCEKATYCVEQQPVRYMQIHKQVY